MVAAAGDDRLLPVVEEYLLARSIGPHWSSVPWALWPGRRELFVLAWRRFFVEREPTEWAGTLLVRSFLAEPEAIAEIRVALSAGADDRWNALREALLRQVGEVTWLSPDQRAALDRVVS